MWLGVSSAKSWEEFSDWYRHISEGAFAAGPAVKAKAAEIAARHSARQDRIREAFQFVSALRYAAIEFGIGGIRPVCLIPIPRLYYGSACAIIICWNSIIGRGGTS